MTKPTKPMRSMTQASGDIVPAMKSALRAIYPPQAAEERARNLAHHMQLLLADAQDWPRMWVGCLELVEFRPELMYTDVSEEQIEMAAVDAMRRYIVSKERGEFLARFALKTCGVPSRLLGMAA